MKNLADTFLSEADHGRIRTAVAAAEKKTAGEIVCMVVSSSYHYPLANVLGAMAAALPISLLGTHFLGAWLWIGSQNMWLFLGLFAICFALFHWALERVPGLKRRFISRREIDEEVHRILKAADAEAHAIVSSNRDAVEAVTQALIPGSGPGHARAPGS